MKPLRTRLQEARKRLGIPWIVLERDYLLSWVLAGIGRVVPLRGGLVFKGGTALKKCYFGDYRFSEDLDFSMVGGALAGNEIEQAMNAVCVTAQELLDEFAPVEINCERYTEKEPHPGGQEAFTIRARFPWQRQPHTRVTVEISLDEKVITEPVERDVIHEYGEPLEARIYAYTLEEIVTEKLRTILQHMERLRERGWSRSRARDYYDLWRVLGTYKPEMDLSSFPLLLKEKCRVRNVGFSGPESFFQEAMLAYVGKTWNQWLGPLVPDLPPFDIVIGDLRPQIAAICE